MWQHNSGGKPSVYHCWQISCHSASHVRSVFPTFLWYRQACPIHDLTLQSFVLPAGPPIAVHWSDLRHEQKQSDNMNWPTLDLRAMECRILNAVNWRENHGKSCPLSHIHSIPRLTLVHSSHTNALQITPLTQLPPSLLKKQSASVSCLNSLINFLTCWLCSIDGCEGD